MKPIQIPRRCADCGREFTKTAQYLGLNFRIVCRARGACRDRVADRLSMIASERATRIWAQRRGVVR